MRICKWKNRNKGGVGRSVGYNAGRINRTWCLLAREKQKSRRIPRARVCSSGRVPAQQAKDSEFKPQYYNKTKQKG
jgi:hypothetical protein